MDSMMKLKDAYADVLNRYLKAVGYESLGREFNDEMEPVVQAFAEILVERGVPAEEAANIADDFLASTENIVVDVWDDPRFVEVDDFMTMIQEVLDEDF